ncbi:MAG: hypothetical protein HY069_03370 [Chlamydiia bacterium]|nr:hypothetical protein [Chlamydiia bacterium]
MNVKKWKKPSLIVLCITLCALTIPVINKSLPIVRAKESFRTTFPKEKFQARLNAPAKPWMVEQINRDFQDFEEKKIDALMLNKTYQHICQNVSQKTPFYHYRILDNELYKFVPHGAPFSDTDSSFEKAFKTLLIYAKVPDVDFILCPMDGMPEPYMPAGFFMLEDFHDQAPVFAQAKIKEPLTKYIVLIPDQFSLNEEWEHITQEILALNNEIDWNQKREVAIWRGGLTDTGVPNEQFVSHLASCPRFNLCKKSVTFPLLVDAGFNWVDKAQQDNLQKEGVIKEELGKKAHLLCKYLPVLDGHMCTYPGYQWRLLSNSVCFKQESDQIQWFYAALKPYVHYIPIQNDVSDLLEKIEWAKSHDEDALKISKQAQEFALKNLLLEDNYFYLYLVLQKQASLEKIDFSRLKKEMQNDSQWKCIQYRKRLALQKSFNRIKRVLAV